MPTLLATYSSIPFAIGAGILLAIPFLYLNVRFATQLGLIDWPKSRGVAEDHVPIVGAGLALVLTLAMIPLCIWGHLSPWFVTPAIIMAVMGFVDDKKPLPAIDKLFFQTLCAVAVVALDPSMDALVLQKHGIVGGAVTVLFIVGLVNAINFIDGIDGLAALVMIVGGAGYLLMVKGGPSAHAQIALGGLIVGIFIPFFYINTVRRAGFLGNVGSYFFSYVLATLHASAPVAGDDLVGRFSLSLLCFLVPVADASMVILSRIFTGRSPFQADKGHLHHRLVQTSIPLRFVLLCFLWIEVTALALAVALARTPNIGKTGLPFFACFALVTLVGILIVLSEKASRRRLQAYFQRLDTGQPIYFFKYRISKPDGSPISATQLARLEARVSAEIRVTDLCYLEKPNILFVTLRTLQEPLKGISGRIDTIFQSERVHSTVVIDQGEFVKVSKPGLSASIRAAV